MDASSQPNPRGCIVERLREGEALLLDLLCLRHNPLSEYSLRCDGNSETWCCCCFLRITLMGFVLRSITSLSFCLGIEDFFEHREVRLRIAYLCSHSQKIIHEDDMYITLSINQAVAMPVSTEITLTPKQDSPDRPHLSGRTHLTPPAEDTIYKCESGSKDRTS